MPWDLRVWQERLERMSTHHPDAWSPAIDVYETSAAYVVMAEVPGISRDEIDLSLEDYRLTLRGRRTDRHNGNDIVHFHQVERGHGAFVRTFEFGGMVDITAVSADLSNGVLTVTLPKVSPPPARRIDVK
jgi:HSP20 family protein